MPPNYSIFPIHSCQGKSRNANAPVFTFFRKGIAITYTATCFYQNTLTRFYYHRIPVYFKLFFSPANQCIFIEGRILERFAPTSRRYHVGNAMGCFPVTRKAYVFLNQFPISSWNYKWVSLLDIRHMVEYKKCAAKVQHIL